MSPADELRLAEHTAQAMDLLAPASVTPIAEEGQPACICGHTAFVHATTRTLGEGTGMCDDCACEDFRAVRS